MSSIVIDLQDEILSSDCDIVQILRRAHVIAVKLGLKEFDQWISYELNGYPDQNACPDYRKVRGTLKAFNPYHGWIPAVITDGELETVILFPRSSRFAKILKAGWCTNSQVIRWSIWIACSVRRCQCDMRFIFLRLP